MIRFELGRKVVCACVGLFAIACAQRDDLADLKDSAQALRTRSENALKESADSLRADFTRSMRVELDSLHNETSRSQNALAELEESRRQIVRGLPGIVSLDSVNGYYSARWTESNFNETFETSAGNITFSKSDFDFAYVPSSKAVAFIRIGKSRDDRNSREVALAWLTETAAMKQKMGYTRKSQKNGPSEYGSYREAVYEKGDAYFKTYFKESRVSGTYGRHSMEYDFFVEFGSKVRAEQYRLERLNNRLGSE